MNIYQHINHVAIEPIKVGDTGIVYNTVTITVRHEDGDYKHAKGIYFDITPCEMTEHITRTLFDGSIFCQGFMVMLEPYSRLNKKRIDQVWEKVEPECEELTGLFLDGNYDAIIAKLSAIMRK
jgi:hypothetical protein